MVMKVIVLVDNSAKRDSHLLAEHGLSLHIECDNLRLIFDTGDTDIYLKNAEKMGIDLSEVDFIALSHNHYDHVGGVKYFPLQNRRVKLVAQEHAFYPRATYCNDLSRPDIIERFDVLTVDSDPFDLSENLVFLGSIPCFNNFEKRKNFGKVILPSGKYTDDFCKDDSALMYKSSEGIVVITGCSHSGMCNIIQYAIILAKKKWGMSKVKTIVGGLHLINSDSDLLVNITDFLKNNEISEIYPCHCTDLKTKISLTKAGFRVNEVSAGMVLSFS